MGGLGLAGNGIISDDATSLIRLNSETQLPSLQAAVLFNYELNKNLELQLGLNYTSSKSEVDYINQYKETVRNVTSH